MHIMEGFLPVEHALGWSIAAAPFVALGAKHLVYLVFASIEQLYSEQ